MSNRKMIDGTPKIIGSLTAIITVSLIVGISAGMTTAWIHVAAFGEPTMGIEGLRIAYSVANFLAGFTGSLSVIYYAYE